MAVALTAGAAAAECRQALVLGLDVSGSVDEDEYRLQLDGLAGALMDADVRAAILAFPGDPVAVAVFEWSSAQFQQVIVDWRLLAAEGDIAAVALRLTEHRRSPAPQATGIGAALGFAETLLARGPDCWRRTVDISGDGTNNDFPPTRQFYAEGGLSGVTVNALVIGQDAARFDDRRNISINELMAYFRANVIRGPGAFTEAAIGYSDFAPAMRRKLLREVSGVAVGAAPLPVRVASGQ